VIVGNPARLAIESSVTQAYSSEEGYLHQPGTLSDLWMEAAEFYSILSQWSAVFEAEWNAADKIEGT